MNVVLDFNQINLKNVSFLDSKKNIILNGKFTRFMYTDDCMSMNGLYINFPIFTPYHNTNITTNSNPVFPSLINYNSKDTHIPRENEEGFIFQNKELNNDNKNFISFNTNNPHNINIIKYVCDLEYQLLEYYRLACLTSDKDFTYKNLSTNLSNQINLGKLKLYKEKNTKSTNNSLNDNPEKYMDLVSSPIFNIKGASSTVAKKQNVITYPPPGFSKINYSLSDSNLSNISNMFSQREIGGFEKRVNSFNKKENEICMENGRYYNFLEKNLIHKKKKSVIVLKISGIWETKDEIGLTYKFLETWI